MTGVEIDLCAGWGYFLFAAFSGYEEETGEDEPLDPYEVHPDQIPIDAAQHWGR